MRCYEKCEHCGGDIYAGGEDEWWVCAGCGCVWRVDGVLLSRGEECLAFGQPPGDR